MAKPLLLEVNDLEIAFGKGKSPKKVIYGISYGVASNEIVGIVGESGSGKSVTSLAVAGLLPKKKTNINGSMLFEGKELLKLPPNELRK